MTMSAAVDHSDWACFFNATFCRWFNTQIFSLTYLYSISSQM